MFFCFTMLEEQENIILNLKSKEKVKIVLNWKTIIGIILILCLIYDFCVSSSIEENARDHRICKYIEQKSTNSNTKSIPLIHETFTNNLILWTTTILVYQGMYGFIRLIIHETIERVRCLRRRKNLIGLIVFRKPFFRSCLEISQ